MAEINTGYRFPGFWRVVQGPFLRFRGMFSWFKGGILWFRGVFFWFKPLISAHFWVQKAFKA